MIPMPMYKTRVLRYGAFWKVQRWYCGEWVNMRDLYSTRQQARNARHYWGQ